MYVVGVQPGAARVCNQPGDRCARANGTVASLESATPLSISATIPVGVKPVYGVMTADTRRAFILNQGSGTVSVINVVNNALDSTTPVIPATGTIGTNPVWADLSPKTSQLVVLNAGDGNACGVAGDCEHSAVHAGLAGDEPAVQHGEPGGCNGIWAGAGDGAGGHQPDDGFGAAGWHGGVCGEPEGLDGGSAARVRAQ